VEGRRAAANYRTALVTGNVTSIYLSRSELLAPGLELLEARLGQLLQLGDVARFDAGEIEADQGGLRRVQDVGPEVRINLGILVTLPVTNAVR